MNVREIILSVLMEYDKSDCRKPSLLKDTLDKYDYLETRDKAFIKRVVDGCLERNIQIDYIINSFSKTETGKMQPLIRSLMRMGTYQIMFMDQVPDSAACNEAVKLAVKHKFSGLKGFVNGVLRNISRNKDKIEYPDKESDSSRYLSVCYSVPEWLCQKWEEEYGFERTEDMLKFFLQPRPTTIRVNLSKAQNDSDIADRVKELKESLEKAGATANINKYIPYAIELEKTDNIRFLPGFSEGEFIAQDVSSMLVTHIADPKRGQNIIDVCAAPGGKSTHAAERVGEEGKVFSRDLSDKKCDLIKENAERLGLSNITTKVHDAKINDSSMRENADILYLDVPCSGLGIIGRKNDIKLNVSRQSMEELTALQWEIVKASWDYVKKGGIMIYSTCTVNRAENQDMVNKICEELPFELVDIDDKLPEGMKSTGKGFIQILPGQYDTDGFFIAKLKRIG
ncbi:16S rRNA (cytosine(967)-C(5))-methyltransferase RsmB [Butyrivibrio proteoclasticus]|uniref:16S rRNA (cytosine(967)-C(5))-methyltransferase RsmB n=1 Tax=Butyrivibrio proteoclasticus TaxID=43305 RepID=UPI00047A32BC|nr:16S rRNA (cytosine(967)-C(5))-methyltransferase RsmB [Butyrivibrio proteoclasticus]